MNSHDQLWLELSREIAKAEEFFILPWDSKHAGILNAWSKICDPSQIPSLQERLLEKQNPKAEQLTKEALRLAKART